MKALYAWGVIVIVFNTPSLCHWSRGRLTHNHLIFSTSLMPPVILNDVLHSNGHSSFFVINPPSLFSKGGQICSSLYLVVDTCKSCMQGVGLVPNIAFHGKKGGSNRKMECICTAWYKVHKCLMYVGNTCCPKILCKWNCVKIKPKW